MKRVIGVECWADSYFFGRLLADKSLIRKEKTKSEVFKSLRERSKGQFSVGIVDSDNDAITTFLAGFEIEYRLKFGDEIELFKFKGYPYFIIQLSPKEFENWIASFLEKQLGKQQQWAKFNYSSLKDFTNDCKVVPEKLQTNERFKTLMDFVFENYSKTDNHINTIKKILLYLLDNCYSVDINKLKNV